MEEIKAMGLEAFLSTKRCQDFFLDRHKKSAKGLQKEKPFCPWAKDQARAVLGHLTVHIGLLDLSADRGGGANRTR